LSKDEQGNAHLRHRVSLKTGVYRGRKVLDLTKKLDKKASKVSKASAR